MIRTILASVALACPIVASAAAQQTGRVGEGANGRVVAALTRDSVRVGDPFGVAVQFDVPAGGELLIPDTIDVFGDLENSAAKRVRIDTLASGALRYLITYPLSAWKPGEHTLPHITAIVRVNQDDQTFDVTLPTVTVISVLPADTTNVEAKPPRDVWGASRLWWPIVLAVLVALAIIGLAIWWWRRHRRKQGQIPAPAIPALLPREWALQELARIRDARYVERNDLRGFYIDLSHTLRAYAERMDAGWGEDLTTTELAYAMRSQGTAAEPLLRILQRADLVKFAREATGATDARSDLDAATQWVESFTKSEWLMAEAA